MPKDPVAVVLGKEAAREKGGREEAGLGGKVGQAHKETARKCMTLELPYGVAVNLCKPNM